MKRQFKPHGKRDIGRSLTLASCHFLSAPLNVMLRRGRRPQIWIYNNPEYTAATNSYISRQTFSLVPFLQLLSVVIGYYISPLIIYSRCRTFVCKEKEGTPVLFPSLNCQGLRHLTISASKIRVKEVFVWEISLKVGCLNKRDLNN